MALLLFSSILSTEVRGLPLGVLDLSDGPTSRRILRELSASGNFRPSRWSSRPQIESALRSGDLGAAIVFPPDLERERARTLERAHHLERHVERRIARGQERDEPGRPRAGGERRGQSRGTQRVSRAT